MRRILNELHRYSSSGIIDSEILKDYEVANIEELSDLLRNKKFDDVRQWVVANLDNEPTVLLRQIYDSLSEMLKSESIPEAIVIISDYSYKSAFVVQEINLVSCLV